jgi:hypothetical protein
LDVESEVTDEWKSKNSQESKDDQGKREGMEAKVNARNDKSQYHLRM